MEPAAEGVESEGADQAEMLWTVRLGEMVPRKRWVVVACAVFAGLMGQLLFQHPMFALIGFFAILLSGAELIFPVHCRLGADGASTRCGISVSSIPWSDVRRTIEFDDGVRLSPVAEGSRLEAFRGVFLRYAGNREAVLAKIRAFTCEHE